jgi:hypothetical protein
MFAILFLNAPNPYVKKMQVNTKITVLKTALFQLLPLKLNNWSFLGLLNAFSYKKDPSLQMRTYLAGRLG